MPGSRRTALALTFGLAAGAGGCTRRADAFDLPGTYLLARGAAVDTLVVRADGRWERRLTVGGRRVRTDSGPWTIETATGERRVAFEGFDPAPGADGSARPGLWAVAAERGTLGEVRLPVDHDLGVAFVRVSAAQ